jgi:DNA-binding transcriptional regulator YiaG
MKQKVPKFDIKKLRKQLLLTQEQAAASIGVSTRSWQRMESSPVSLPRLVEFIQANGGKFRVPDNPFDVFIVGEFIFSQKDFTV